MLEWIKKIWTDSVFSKLIAEGIIRTISAIISAMVVLILGASSYYAGWWPKIWEFLLSTQDIPNWTLCILSIVILFCVLSSIVIMKSHKRSSTIDHTKKDVLQLQKDIEEIVYQFAADSEIKILSPQEGTHQKMPVLIVVSCKNLPKSFELWLFTIDEYLQTNPNYWPIRSTSKVEGGTWSLSYSTTQFKSGDHRRFGVFLVGKDGQKLIDHYRMAGKDKSPTGDLPWTPITKSQFTSDMVQCGETCMVHLL